MNNIISTLEIAVIIILPLIIIYKRNNINTITNIKCIVLIYLIWYLTYAFFHEVSHLIGVWIFGLKVNDFQLIPHFWKGDFGTGYISTTYDSALQEFVVDIMPYFRDLILLIAGYLILKRYKISGLLLFGFIIVLLILSPLYDVFNNYFAFVQGSLNDFNAMKNYVGNLAVHAIGVSITILGLIIVGWVLLSKRFAENYFKQFVKS